MGLILVYNADSGFFNIVKDGLHKIVSPSTYQCNLCALTYGTVKMKDEWIRVAVHFTYLTIALPLVAWVYKKEVKREELRETWSRARIGT